MTASDNAELRFELLTAAREIAAAEEQLIQRFQNAATWKGKKRLGYQGGSMEKAVCWVAGEGVWLSNYREENRWWNGFGTVDPRETQMLTITVEINPPMDGVDRRCAGAFLRDDRGRLYLTHTGRVGGGRKGIGKREFLSRFKGSIAEVDGYEYILVGRLDADDFIRNVAGFVKVVDAFKNEVAGAVPNEGGESAENGVRIWLFQANSRRFNLAEDVKHRQPGSTDTWTVTRYEKEMKEGDRLVLWQGGEAAGIYAVGTLTGEPAEQEGENPFTSGDQRRPWSRVSFRYDEIIEPPLTKEEVQEDGVLSGLRVLHQPQGTNYRVEADQWDRLRELLREGPTEDESAQELADYVRAWYPDEGVRRICVEWVVGAIQKANSTAPGGWATSVRRGPRIRLTVGRNLAFELRDGNVGIGLHEPSLSDEARARLQKVAENDDFEFKLSPGCSLYWIDAQTFASNEGLLRAAFQRFVDVSLDTAKRSPVARSHNDAVLGALELLSGEKLPRPQHSSATTSFWKIAPERHAALWKGWQEGGHVSIGWSDLGDLTGLDRVGFEQRLEAGLNRNPSWRRSGGEQVWRFKNIPPGSRVVANDGTRRVLGIGTVTGSYAYAPGDRYPHRLPVRWDDLSERVVDRPGWRRTLIRLTKADFEEILRAPSPGSEPAPEPVEEVEPEDKLDFEGLYSALANQGLHFPEELVATYLLALQTKRFVILSGISGTGKTRLAIEVARILQGEEVAEPAMRSGMSDLFPITVKPYGIKYKRFVLPSALVGRTPGLMERALETKSLTLKYPSGEQQVRIWKPEGANNLFLLLSGRAATWYVDTFQADDRFFVRLEPDQDGHPTVVHVLTEAEEPPKLQRQYAIVAVRPDWTDRHGLLGFYNPLTNDYQVTPFLDLLIRAKAEQERARKEGRAARPYFVVLDEMNLARVEHYFSDFLSCLESGEPIHLHDDPELEAESVTVPSSIEVPRNLFFTGTVNIDETTYMFSPKVLDRAFTLEFNEVDLGGFGVEDGDDEEDKPSTPLRLERFDGALAISAIDPCKKDDRAKEWRRFRGHLGGRLAEILLSLNHRLQPEHRHFGYRVANEIARFVNLAADQASKEDVALWAALDVAVLSKVLPKLHGTQQELEGTLSRLFAYALDLEAAPNDTASDTAWRIEAGQLVPTSDDAERKRPTLPRTATKLWRMLARLRQQGFASFIE
jgi:hypothetical protein